MHDSGGPAHHHVGSGPSVALRRGPERGETMSIEGLGMSTSASVTPSLRRPDEGDGLWFLGSLVTVKAAGARTGGRLTVVEIVNPPGFAPPLHRHLVEDEAFYVLDGTVQSRPGEQALDAGPGDFVLLPAGQPHTFVVGPHALRTLQITTPSGFEDFAA